MDAFQKRRVALSPTHDVHRLDCVASADFLQHYQWLASVWSGPEIKVDHCKQVLRVEAVQELGGPASRAICAQHFVKRQNFRVAGNQTYAVLTLAPDIHPADQRRDCRDRHQFAVAQ